MEIEIWQLLVAVVVAIVGSTGFWNWLINRKASNKDLMEKLDKVEDNIGKLEYKVDKNEVITCRARLLRFNRELINQEKHTHEEFKTILDDADVYERFCAAHPDFRNNYATLSIENIKRCYKRCEEQHDFL